jgi:hypothetical protein
VLATCVPESAWQGSVCNTVVLSIALRAYEEQEEESADKFATACHEVISHRVIQTVSEWKSSWL